MEGRNHNSSKGQSTAGETVITKAVYQTNSDVGVGTNDNQRKGIIDRREVTEENYINNADATTSTTSRSQHNSDIIDLYKDVKHQRNSEVIESIEYGPTLNNSAPMEDSVNPANSDATLTTKDKDKLDAKVTTTEIQYLPEESSRDSNGGKGSTSCNTTSSNNRTPSKTELHRWLVVLGCFMCNLITGGIDRSDGIFYLKFLDKYKGSALASSWAVSLPGALRLVIGPLSSALSERFSARSVVITGGFLLFLSFLATGFSPSLLYIYIAFGLVGGVGRSFLYTPGLVVVGQYFAEKPGLAVGVATSGVGAGTFALPPLVNFLFEEYVFWEVFTFVGLICLNAIAFGALLRPKGRSGGQCCRKHGRKEKGNKINCSKENPVQIMYINHGFSSEDTPKQVGAMGKSSATDYRNELDDSCQPEDTVVIGKDSPNIQDKHPKKSEERTGSTDALDDKKAPSSTAKLFDLSLLSNPCFVMFCVSILLFTSAFRAAFTFLPALAESRGCTNAEAALLMSVAGILDATGRIFCGYVLDLKSIRNLRPFAYSVILLLISCASFTCPLMFGFLQFALMFGCYGFMTGAYVSQKSVILVDILGVEKLSSSFGLLLLAQGLGSLMGPPLSGFLMDTLGNYGNVFYLGGGMMAGASVVMVISNMLLASQRRRVKEGLSDDVIAPTALG